jgi:hypothetical protein
MDTVAYHIQVADETLRNLRERLKHTRWSDEVQGQLWARGTLHSPGRASAGCRGSSLIFQTFPINGEAGAR